MPSKIILSVFTSFLVISVASGQTDPLEPIRELTESGHYQEALDTLNAFLDREPNHVEGKLYRGVIFTRRGDVQRAIESFQALSEDYPALPEPHNNLAVLYASQRRYEQARQSLVKAVELQPNYDTAHENLGDLYTKLAIIAYQKAYNLNRDNERALAKETHLREHVDVPTPANLEDVEVLAAKPDTTMPAGEESSPAPACYHTAGFADESIVVRAESWFAQHRANAVRVEQNVKQLLGYRVLVDQLGSHSHAQTVVTELTAKGVTDLLIVSDNAVSLGVYATEAAANRRVAQISALGVTPSIEPRFKETQGWFLKVSSDPSSQLATLFPQAFAGQSLNSAPCTTTTL